MKISEVMNSTDGMIEVETDNIKLLLYPFKLKYWIQLEEEGFTREQVAENLNSKPATWSTKVAWMIMDEDSKKEFEDDINEFRDTCNYGDLEAISNGIIKSVEMASPKEKTVKKDNKKKQTKKTKKKTGKK